jgi:RNA polymerase sigma-70 factor (ECF subfamily)
MTVRIPLTGQGLGPNPEENDENSKKSVRDWAAFVAVYDGLREAARRRMKTMGDYLSLGATGLVHEVFLRLKADPKFDPKAHPYMMFGSAMRCMREILIDRARSRKRLKRGGGMQRVGLEHADDRFEVSDFDILEVHNALIRLEELDRRQAIIVTMRYFLRMTNAEVAALLECSESLVERELRMARAWLRQELKDFGPES